MGHDNDHLTLSGEEGRCLVMIARRAITSRLKNESIDDIQAPGKAGVRLEALCAGTFVTLTISGELRGCIGSFREDIPLPQSVKNNAINAAFNDPRFSPLTLKELERVCIEVSVLSPAKPLIYENTQDLLVKLRPGRDGVILHKGSARATFLPQVWSQLPRPEEFLGHLCLKAGLPADSWKREILSIDTYRVQSYEETQE
jgi:AmmeMemoRadiSam system protein A